MQQVSIYPLCCITTNNLLHLIFFKFSLQTRKNYCRFIKLFFIPALTIY